MHSDNTGAERAASRGTAKSWDHCQIVQEIWTLAYHNQTHLWLQRVATDDNIADLPSREEYQLMRDIGAVWREPVLANLVFTDVFSIDAQSRPRS